MRIKIEKQNCIYDDRLLLAIGKFVEKGYGYPKGLKEICSHKGTLQIYWDDYPKVEMIVLFDEIWSEIGELLTCHFIIDNNGNYPINPQIA